MKLYAKSKPYGKLTIIGTGKKYWLLAPVPMALDTWTEVAGLQAWTCVSASDGMPEQYEYSKELKAILHDPPITLLVHPSRVFIELYNSDKEIYYYSGEEVSEPIKDDLDLSEDDNYINPDYLMDVMPDGFPV